MQGEIEPFNVAVLLIQRGAQEGLLIQIRAHMMEESKNIQAGHSGLNGSI